MSGGNFLVSLREIEMSEKILKLKSMMKEDIEWRQVLIRDDNLTEDNIAVIESKIQDINSDSLILDNDSQEVAAFISGYIAKKLTGRTEHCCANLLTGNTENREYLDLMSRGGLQVPSQELSSYVCWCFAVLEEVFPTITMNCLPARISAEYFLTKLSVSTYAQFSCAYHSNAALSAANRICCNIFFNNERKRKSAAASDDRVKTFKRQKRNL